ncbi:D-alanyl-D-alanine carboxypeptidase/D-alanyl-D-alanine endopeptidase [Actinophytocola algeriensis]|uniref:D-alanyl-D-alanine carboxypeptidase/D-alanyl-D-alanine-endopeptidase (Penicillin-binding protein 4) n=1 Tax=Actinophytocola algeriensis TaxID=1768010 RepID=A0A7W7Q525_9PSEU|nr:D-alanyl-D-alanine carboxypeptidase/D-alanyl-D-alanine-endopeptidase [Actinophytocola algeriensis]MBB4907206.1 D-alanyl-D-alanine carboxypeptidase/D-alanyl-D-alanine-endopeptidase (penicillin-binding protein 4) [Actinophytocola algeriensis]MBE1478689.1 D-alanyl-D-alanine carboxypeptidase/D-alanyl-D-alanine-endopeptidase (penicillin-binding protein 4) [Actinophytocola algeriensis]
MPQSGDGDLWPTTDDDSSSARAKDAETHELPVPDQQKEPAEQAESQPAPAEDADSEPDTEAPETAGEGRDEPHARPEQQITQPVSWPVADLERQAAEDPVRSFSRPLPKSADAKTAIVKRPAWPPSNEEKATPDAAQAESEQASTDKDTDTSAEGLGRPRSTGGDSQRDAPSAGGSDEPGPGRQETQGAAAGASRPSAGDDERTGRQQSSEPGPRPANGVRNEPGGGAGDRREEGARRRPEDAPTSFVRPVSPPPRKESAPPSFLRPDNRQENRPHNRQDTRPDNNETSFVRRQEPPSFVRADNSATTFIRRDKSFTDSTTVNLSRPERPEPDRRADWPPPEPARAAPRRVGAHPEADEPESEQEQTKTRKPLLIAAISIAAVIAIAAGVVFGIPGVSDKLGLTGEDPVAIAPPPSPVSYTPALHGPDAATPGPTRQGVEQALSGPMASSALGNVNGIVIDPATGETLYEKNADGATTPASTGKILTAAAALLSLDPTEQLATMVVEGDQPGEVIIVGGGDPTISSLPVGEESIYPGAAHLSELVDQVKASGAQVQTVYIDQSRYAAPGLAPSWLPADIGAGYIAPIVPAMLDGDRQGDPTENYVARTTDPGATLVDEFADRIGASPAGSIEKKAAADAKVLGEIRSAPVTQLVDNMLNRSENTLADVLAREVAVKAGEEPNFDGASKAMLDILRENGFVVDGVTLRDGSGMSEENKMTARLLAEVLAVAASPDGKDPRTAKLRPLLGGLPVAGGSGTLADRYTEGESAAGKGWVRAKTGSLTGINSLAGIVLDKDNRPLVFAFLTSGTVSTSARPALDNVTAALRGCGCQ